MEIQYTKWASATVVHLRFIYLLFDVLEIISFHLNEHLHNGKKALKKKKLNNVLMNNCFFFIYKNIGWGMGDQQGKKQKTALKNIP